MAPIVLRRFRRILHETRWLIVKHDFLKNQPKENLIVVVGSAHKVGSTWLYGLIKDTFDFDNGYVPNEFDECRNGIIILEHPSVEKYFSSLNGRYIFKSHSYPIPVTTLGGAKIITILRDPRDVIVSCAFYGSSGNCVLTEHK